MKYRIFEKEALILSLENRFHKNYMIDFFLNGDSREKGQIRDIILDFNEVKFIDHFGILNLIEIIKFSKVKGLKIIVANANRFLRELFLKTGIAGFIVVA